LGYGLGMTVSTPNGVAGMYHDTDLRVFANTGGIRLITEAGEKMRILTNGDVGIGTTAPEAKLEVAGPLANYSDSVRYYRNVAHHNSVGGAETGTLKITMPKSWATTMMQARIQGYDYATGVGAWEVIVAGYSYDGNWHKCTAEINGSAPFSEVRLAHDGSKTVILLGNTSTTWSYPQIAVSEFMASFMNMEGWGSGWSMSFITDEAGIASVVTPAIPTYMTSAGNVGIGTAAPGTNKLHIYNGSSGGTAYDAGGLVVEDSGRASIQLLAPNDQDSYVFFGDANSGTGGYIGHLGTSMSPADLMVYYSEGNHSFTNGNVGIGTTVPGAKLAITGDGENPIDLILDTSDSSSNNAGVLGLHTDIYFRPNSDSAGRAKIRHHYNTYNSADSELSFWTQKHGGTYGERVRIDNAGDVGIGTTNPQALLHIEKDQNAPSHFIIQNDTDGITSLVGIKLDSDSGISYIQQRAASHSTNAGKLLIHADSNTTGMLLETASTADPIAFEVGDSEVMRISNGYVGIGITNPGAKLEVINGDTYLQATSIGQSGGHYQELGYNVGFTPTNDMYTYRYNDTAASIRLGESGGDITFRTAPSGTLGTALTLTERMRIDVGGDVGIGTTLPAYPLHVHEDAADWVTYFDNDHSSGYGVLINTGGTGTNDAFAIDTGVAGTRQFVVENNGNVGVGTANPTAQLHVAKTGDVTTTPLLEITTDSGNITNPRVLFKTTGDGRMLRVQSATARTDMAIMDVVNSVGTVFSIRGDGNIGIGTTMPGQKLDVNGNVKLGANTNWSELRLGTAHITDTGGSVYSPTIKGASDNSTKTYMTFWTDNEERIRIRTGGNVGIGTDSPDYDLDVVGTINASEAVLVAGSPADYVFEDDYDLKTIEEQAAFMWANKHLPALKSADELDGRVNLAERLEQSIEELEKAHVYIEQMNNGMKDLKAENELMKVRIDALENK
ncbi:hypothetical protein ACFL57_05490, partial [Candidatus Margulisiibacteriota bacterium]